jgi:hypothetical protein
LRLPWKNQPISLQAPLHEQLIAEVVGKMPVDHRKFLLGLKRGEPDWKLLGVPGAEELAAVRWKLQNLAKIDKEKRAELIAMGLGEPATQASRARPPCGARLCG